MKFHLPFLALAFSFLGTLNAQDVYDEIAEETCDCISEQDLSKMTMGELQLKLSLCMSESFPEHSETLKNKHGLDVTDQEDVEKIGAKLGVVMASSCPVFMSRISEMLREGDSDLKELLFKEEVAEVTKEMTGKLVELKEERFAVIVLKDESGRSHEFIWMGYFEGAQGLFDNFHKMKGKSFTITYTESESFLPKANDYHYIKVIRSLKPVK